MLGTDFAIVKDAKSPNALLIVAVSVIRILKVALDLDFITQSKLHTNYWNCNHIFAAFSLI